MINFQLWGDWAKAADATKAINTQLSWILRNAGKSLSRRIVKRIKEHIDSQDLGWASLNPKTITLDDRTLVSTQLYYDSIGFFEVGKSFFIGVKKGIIYPDRDHEIEVGFVGILHEYGTKNMPERPLWNPTIQEFGGPTGIRDYISGYLRNYLNKKGIPITGSYLNLLNSIEPYE